MTSLCLIVLPFTTCCRRMVIAQRSPPRMLALALQPAGPDCGVVISVFGKFWHWGAVGVKLLENLYALHDTEPSCWQEGRRKKRVATWRVLLSSKFQGSISLTATPFLSSNLLTFFLFSSSNQSFLSVTHASQRRAVQIKTHPDAALLFSIPYNRS